MQPVGADQQVTALLAAVRGPHANPVVGLIDGAHGRPEPNLTRGRGERLLEIGTVNSDRPLQDIGGQSRQCSSA
jgi:hypothetical protein